MKLFYFKTNLTQENIDKIVSSMSPSDKIYGTSVNMKVFDVIENGRLSMYAFCDDTNIEKALYLYNKYNVELTIQDISDNAIMGEVKVNDDEFNLILNDWLADNLTVNDVLDKINKFGIKSLTELDKKVLESYK